MAEDMTELRTIYLEGPPFVTVDEHGKQQVHGPMWRVRVGAPNFRDPERHPPNGITTEDSIHPIRTLLMDGQAAMFGALPGRTFREPRLMSLHVVAGWPGGHYGSPHLSEPPERLEVYLGPRALGFRDWSLFPPYWIRTGTSTTQAEFVHVLAEPRPDDLGWPVGGSDGHLGDAPIRVPKMRLVEGRIPLQAQRKHVAWLGNLGLGSEPLRLSLTPDGLEIQAEVRFPGSGRALAGVFLLAPKTLPATQPEGGQGHPPSALTLKLLSDRLNATQRELWMKAWLTVAPSENAEETFSGLKLLARREGPPPSFEWSLTFHTQWLSPPFEEFQEGGILDDPSLTVEVPREDVGVVLLGSNAAGSETDGTARVRLQRVTLSPVTPDKVTPSSLEGGWSLQHDEANTLSQTLAVPASRGQVVRFDVTGVEAPNAHWTAVYSGSSPQGAHADGRMLVRSVIWNDDQTDVLDVPLMHDERRLAESLRSAYRLPEPGHEIPAPDPEKPSSPDPSRAEAARPLLYGFVPVEQGWVQVPLPNLPPPDLKSDAAMLGAFGGGDPGSALDGFVRFSPRTASAPVSGHDAAAKPVVGDSAPWAMTIEGSRGAGASLMIVAGQAGGSARSVRVTLTDPELSCRGLMWFSVDRPDAVEALPRLGAGPGSFIDVPFTTPVVDASTGVFPPESRIVSFALEYLLFTVRDVAERPALQLSVEWNTAAVSWFDNRLPDANDRPRATSSLVSNANDAAWQAVSDTLVALTGHPSVRDYAHPRPPAPVPAVAWRRHAVLPLAAEMPMTRAAHAAVRPLESRELSPFTLTLEALDPHPSVFRVARLSWLQGQTFPELPDDRGTRVPGWPWGDDDPTKVEAGIAFAALGVPGVEVRPEIADQAWGTVRYAYRYDLPALDEAFATASLPAVIPPSDKDERETAPPPPPATALDWPALATFWGDQQRRHQLSRVVGSYATPFVPVGPEGPAIVTTLIGGARWEVVTGFDRAGVLNELPYGTITFRRGGGSSSIGGATAGDMALRGVSGHFTFDGTAVTWNDDSEPGPGDDPATITVVGWSASTFVHEGFQRDSQRFGVKPPGAEVRGLVLRPIHDGEAAFDLATAVAPYPVRVAGQPRFAFWFKDVALDGAGKWDAVVRLGTDAGRATLFDAWTSLRLPFSGLEWRFWATTPSPRGLGLDVVEFFGFGLEPVRLLTLEVDRASGAVNKVVLLGRLTLFGESGTRTSDGGNLVLLTLIRDDVPGTLKIDNLTAPDDAPIHVFEFEASDAAARTRHVVLRGRPVLTSETVLGDASLDFEFHGIPMRFAGAQVALDSSGALRVTWTGPSGSPASGRGYLQVTNVVLVRRADGPCTITVDSVLEIQPADIDAHRAEEAAVRWVRSTAASGVRTSRVSLLGIQLDLRKDATDAVGFTEDDGALVLVLTEWQAFSLSPCVGWDLAQDTHIAGVLAVVVEPPDKRPDAPPSSRPLPVACGRVEVVLSSWPSDARHSSGFETREIRLLLEAGRREARPGEKAAERDLWKGSLTVFGAVASESALRWPRLAPSGDPNVPDPEHEPNGRVPVTPTGDAPLVHRAAYRLDGHQVAFEHFAIATGPDQTRTVTLDSTWTTLAHARHRLEGEGWAVDWSSVEALSLAPAAVMFARPDAADEPLTFGARYSRDVGNGHSTPNPDVIRPGLGLVRTMLEGALGQPFRDALYAGDIPTGFVAAAGFVGFVPIADAPDVLLRLPFLVGFGGLERRLGAGKLEQSHLAGVELAWADSDVARHVLSVRRHAVAPADRTEAGLLGTLRAGGHSGSDGLEVLEATMEVAVLVEQAFARPRPQALLATAPFFLGAAVTVNRFFDRTKSEFDQTKSEKVVALKNAFSLIAGALVSKSGDRQRLAALVRLGAPGQWPPSIQPPSLPEPVLLSAGSALVEEPWTAGAAATAGKTAVDGMASGLAQRAHARPVFAVVRALRVDSSEAPVDRNERLVYEGRKLPRPVLAEMPRRRAPSALPVFAEPGRGYAAAPGDAAHRRLAAPLQGRLSAIRDDNPDPQPGERHTGVAGIGHALALPAQAASEAGAGSSVGSAMVWLDEKRAPVYLPLDVANVRAPAIPWLATAPPRLRVPTDAEVDAVLLKAGIGHPAQNATGDATILTGLQAFLPGEASRISAAERAGILTARRAMLIAAVPGGKPFDQEYGRFGKPAQAGSSVARQIRTPRPGPLPPNMGDPLRDRRPCASPLRWDSPVRFVVGPADTVRDEGTLKGPDDKSVGPWSALVIAQPDTEGVVTGLWDGSVRLRVVLDVDVTPLKSDEAAAKGGHELARRLFPLTAAGRSELQASAVLVIGGTVFVFQTLKVLASGDFHPAGGPPGTSLVNAVVDLVLDLRLPDAAGTPGAPRSDLAAAIAAGPGPIEVRLTVAPAHRDVAASFNEQETFKLTPPGTGGLPGGETRPPVTLRLPLAAVTEERGALPLVPTTLVFMDPAYEASLANPPAEDGKIVKVVGELPKNRGELQAILSVDRRSVNRRGSLALMLDLRLERPVQSVVTVDPQKVDGDLYLDTETTAARFAVELQVVPKRGGVRRVYAAPIDKPTMIKLAHVYELSLASLREDNGAPARLAAGDVLQITVAAPASSIKFSLFDVEKGERAGPFALVANLSRTVPVLLTDEPVVEPPPALYAVLGLTRRTQMGGGSQRALSVPLHAQSPLPGRVDFRNAKADFRAGLVRRTAVFTWMMARPRADVPLTSGGQPPFKAYVVKSDRSGQTHLPDADSEFQAPDRIQGLP